MAKKWKQPKGVGTGGKSGPVGGVPKQNKAVEDNAAGRGAKWANINQHIKRIQNHQEYNRAAKIVQKCYFS